MPRRPGGVLLSYLMALAGRPELRLNSFRLSMFLFQDTPIQAFRSNIKGFTIALYYDLFNYRTVTKA